MYSKEYRVKRKVIYIASILFFFFPRSFPLQKKKNANRKDQTVIDVSMVQLLARPELYDDKLVQVVGVGNFAFEDNRLFWCKEHWKVFLTKSSIALEPNLKEIGKNQKDLKEMNGKYVIVKGIFQKDANAHLFGTNPALVNVSRWDCVEGK